MNRTIFHVAAALAAVCALSACEAEPAPPTPVATNDGGNTDTAGTSTDAKDAVSGDVVGDATDSSDISKDGTADVTATCKPVCAKGTTCNTKVSPPVCEALPCGGLCKASESCKAEKCVDACDSLCKPDEQCDVANKKCVKQICDFPKAWGPNLQKMSKLAIAATDKGCDLDDDGKPNNVLGKIVSLYKEANTKLAETVADGTVVLILEPKGFKADGSKFDINLLIGDVDETNAKCDVTSETANCKYTITKLSYDGLTQTPGMCPALVTFKDATIKSTVLAAGGEKQKFALNIPLAGINLKLTISQARLNGKVANDKEWVTTKTGQVCGVIGKKDLEAAIDAVPPELLAQIGDKETVKGLVNSILKPDIDTDDDDKPDAISVALDFETVKAQVTGFSK